MAALRGRRKTADERATEAARHAAIRAQAIAATASLAAQAADGAGAIDIEKLADMLGAEIVFGDLDGAKARVVQIGDRARIIISKRIVGVGAIRFCIAHEIGHLLLKHYSQGDDLGRAFKRQRTCEPLTSNGSEIERDACVFATECLMPAPLATPMCQVAPITFEPVRALSSAFATSLQASAMRYVELTSERCAVVYMHRRRVLWAKKSAGFTAWIPDGRAVEPNSAAADYFDDGSLEASRVLPAATWFPREKVTRDATVYEHMTAIPEAAAAFSLLWLPTS
ncbi:MAG: ImmA/IrrE family metallo-endopeptidase [Kofleriaceae bacterium]